MARRILLFVLGGLELLTLVLIFNTLRKSGVQPEVAPVAHVKVDAAAAAERLAGAVRIRTITYDENPTASASEFLKLHQYLQQAFPNAHRAMKREVVGDYSLLYAWQGSNPAANGVMLMAHSWTRGC
jgi:carboxypeptidase PM20D1